MFLPLRWLVALLLAAGAAAVLAAQDPQAPPIFRSSTQFVTVDVVVTGKDDAPVGDLTLEQSVALYEEGMRIAQRCQALLAQVEQRIETLRETYDSGFEL